jgi:nitrite reductase/ring-hydroxylating ferredoxin subunit
VGVAPSAVADRVRVASAGRLPAPLAAFVETHALGPRLEAVRAERRQLRAAAPIPAPPERSERARVLALAEAVWLLREGRALGAMTRRLGVERAARHYLAAARRDPLPVDAGLARALEGLRGGRRVRAFLALSARRHGVDAPEHLLTPEETPMTAPTPDLVPLGPLDDLRPGQAKRVAAHGRTVAVFRVGAKVHAIDDACPHRGGPLGKGDVEDGCAVCPLHGWAFDLETGHMKGNPRIRVQTFEVLVREGELFLGAPREE